VAPQTIKADKSLIAITVDGESYHFQRNEDMVYYPGKLHKFTIKVDKRLPEGDYQFSLLSESITPWENDPESHNGTAREYLVLELLCCLQHKRSYVAQPIMLASNPNSLCA
jgi:hypothetical protein